MATRDPNFDIKQSILDSYEIKKEFSELILEGKVCGCIECEECECEKERTTKNSQLFN